MESDGSSLLKKLSQRSIRSSRPGVFSRKRCSENMQQTYKRTPMPKCDFNKVESNFIEIALRHVYSPSNLLHIFRTSFLRKTFSWLLLEYRVAHHNVRDTSSREKMHQKNFFSYHLLSCSSKDLLCCLSCLIFR